MLSKLKDLMFCPPGRKSGNDSLAQFREPPVLRMSMTQALLKHCNRLPRSQCYNADELEDEDLKLPESLNDANECRCYKPAQLLGRGTFGRCYMLIDTATQQAYAGKIISKSVLVSSLYTPIEMASREISVQRHLCHPHIVQLESFFDDGDYIYIVLELCARGSLRELLLRRKTLSEHECRYFVHQLVLGVQYLHQRHIIHRDLKQENLLLNSQLQLKIADFGLATHLVHASERKQMQCGTLEYTAPEVLSGKGYGLGVDVWAIGCILYELLHGKTPFDSDTLEQTIRRVRRADYQINCATSSTAAHMIKLMLQPKPKSRPPVGKLLRHKFLWHTDQDTTLLAPTTSTVPTDSTVPAQGGPCAD